MSLYSKYVLPRAIHFACNLSPATYQRKKVIPLAEGNVLEIGIGSGLNLRHYDPSKVRSVVGIDPSPATWQLREEKPSDLPFSVEFVEGVAQSMPFENAGFDTVVVTYTLFSIPDIQRAMSEIRRVLKPGGKLVFTEHGLAPDQGVRRWQHGIEPVWKIFSGGCSLTRDMPALIEEGGFTLDKLDPMYIPGWKPASYNYWGYASAR